MRKLAIILVSILFAVICYGQNDNVYQHRNDVTKYLDLQKKKNTYWSYTGVAADTISSNDSTYNYSFGVDNIIDKISIAGFVQLDSVSGTPTTSVILKGKVFWDQDWITLETETWAGTTGDTTLVFDYTTAKAWRFVKFEHDATATTTQKYSINQQEIKIYEE